MGVESSFSVMDDRCTSAPPSGPQNVYGAENSPILADFSAIDAGARNDRARSRLQSRDEPMKRVNRYQKSSATLAKSASDAATC